jgi:hypothetical protein
MLHFILWKLFIISLTISLYFLTLWFPRQLMHSDLLCRLFSTGHCCCNLHPAQHLVSVVQKRFPYIMMFPVATVPNHNKPLYLVYQCCIPGNSSSAFKSPRLPAVPVIFNAAEQSKHNVMRVSRGNTGRINVASEKIKIKGHRITGHKVPRGECRGKALL